MQLRWPLVWRVVHEQRIESYHCDLNRALDHLNDLRAELREARAHNRTLVQTIVEMRREGFAQPPKRHESAPPLSSPVDDAILERAGTNPRLRQHLMRRRDALRREGMKDEEIAERLSTMRDPDPDE